MFANSRELPVISGQQDVPLVLEDLAEAIYIQKTDDPGFEHKFHDNKRVAKYSVRGIDHQPLDWEHHITTPRQLVKLTVCLYPTTSLRINLDKFYLLETVYDTFLSNLTTINWRNWRTKIAQKPLTFSLINQHSPPSSQEV